MPREWSAGDTKYFLPLLLERDGKVCHYCHREVFLESEISRNPLGTRERQMANARKDKKATVDHQIPVSKGGEEFDIDNMVVACLACNNQKGDRLHKKFRKVR